ncbi:MAG TPA: secretin N-terminal domain-containing protein, partial [Burkholderiales bacterium]|nr:secretin N-terminal domain-containing protein [Burkholderiales bacterium]
MKTSCANTLRAAFLAGCIAVCAPALAAEDQVTLNFVNAEIDSVVKAISQITGKNFLIDPRVKGTVNIISGKAIPQSQAYSLLLSALRMQGFAVVEGEGVVKIVPEAEAKTLASPVRTDGGPPRGDQMLTKVFTLHHESAAQLVPVLRPLIAPNNSINANPGNNTLVITDYSSNLERITKVIAALDSPNAAEPKLISIAHASAIDLANMLTRLYGEGAPAADPQKRVSIVADSRSNSLLVQADSPSRMARVVSMILSLDQPTAVGGNIHVIYLKNAEAARLAQTLRGILTGDTSTLQSASTPFGGGASSMATTPAGSAGATTRPLASTTPAPTPGTLPVGGAGAAGGGIIQADVTNNALIITAPDAIYNNLRRVVEMLDTRRAQ